ncbi:hypothetical protein [Rickettsia asembonensis]|nr:hypothetical protein [Rickettsia asembonensis]
MSFLRKQESSTFSCHPVVKPALLHGLIFLLSSRDLFMGSS